MLDSAQIAAASMVIGAVVWLVRLEGRVNTNASIIRSLREDLTYIRDRIDRALNGHDR